MNPRTLMAALVAVLMLAAPCAAFLGTDVAYADDDRDHGTGPAVGDAWGISITANSLEELIEKIEELDIFDDDFDDNFDNSEDQDDEDVLIEQLMTILMENLDIDVEFILSGIIEVTKADSVGYVLSLDAGIYMNIVAVIDIDLEAFYDEIEEALAEILNEEELKDIREMMEGIFGDGELFISAQLAVGALLKGTIRLDEDSELIGTEISIDVSGKISLETNVDILGTIESFPSISDDEPEQEGAEPIVKYLDENDVYAATLGGSYFNRLHISEGTRDEESNEYSILSGSELMMISVYLDLEMPNDVMDLIISFLEGFDDSEFPFDFEYDDDGKLQFSFMDGFSQAINGGMPSGIFFDLDDFNLEKDSDEFLNGEEKNKVRSDLNKVSAKFREMVANLEKFDVTFLDEDDEAVEGLSLKASYGERITLPSLGDNKDGMKFIGWKTQLGGLGWNPVWGVKGDLVLRPIFIEASDNLDDAFDILELDSEGAYVSLNIDNLEDLADFDFSFSGTLYVDIVDDDGNFLYSWSINSSGDTKGKITNFKVMSDNSKLDDVKEYVGNGKSMYLNFSSSGPTPGITTVTYNVSGIYEDGTELSVYFVHEDDEGNVIGVELIETAIVSNGRVVFNVDHCSGYVLSMISIDPDKQDLFLYVVIVVVAIVLIAAIAVLLSRRKKA